MNSRPGRSCPDYGPLTENPNPKCRFGERKALTAPKPCPARKKPMQLDLGLLVPIAAAARNRQRPLKRMQLEPQPAGGRSKSAR